MAKWDNDKLEEFLAKLDCRKVPESSDVHTEELNTERLKRYNSPDEVRRRYERG